MREHSDPMDVDAVNSLSSGKGKGSSSPRNGCFRVRWSTFSTRLRCTQEHRQAIVWQRQNRASHGPRVKVKEKVKKTIENFHQIGEEGINSFVKRIIQGIFVGHHDRTRANSNITKSGIVRGKSWTKPTLSDAWEPTNLEDLFGDSWHMGIRSHTVITETRLTMKCITDEEGAGLLLPRLLVEKPPEVERRRLFVFFTDIEAHGHIGSCPRYALFVSQGEATKPRKHEFRQRVGTVTERTLTGEARMETHKDRIAETERVRQKESARIERGAGDVPMESGNGDDEQVADQHADASGGYIIENQHEEDRMRNIQVSKGGSEAASEEQPSHLIMCSFPMISRRCLPNSMERRWRDWRIS